MTMGRTRAETRTRVEVEQGAQERVETKVGATGEEVEAQVEPLKGEHQALAEPAQRVTNLRTRADKRGTGGGPDPRKAISGRPPRNRRRGSRRMVISA